MTSRVPSLRVLAAREILAHATPKERIEIVQSLMLPRNISQIIDPRTQLAAKKIQRAYRLMLLRRRQRGPRVGEKRRRPNGLGRNRNEPIAKRRH